MTKNEPAKGGGNRFLLGAEGPRQAVAEARQQRARGSREWEVGGAGGGSGQAVCKPHKVGCPARLR